IGWSVFTHFGIEERGMESGIVHLDHRLICDSNFQPVELCHCLPSSAIGVHAPSSGQVYIEDATGCVSAALQLNAAYRLVDLLHLVADLSGEFGLRVVDGCSVCAPKDDYLWRFG